MIPADAHTKRLERRIHNQRTQLAWWADWDASRGWRHFRRLHVAMMDWHHGRKLKVENARLRVALNKALALCRYCDGTSTVPIADVETGEMIGAEHCEKCWPLRSPKDTGASE